MTLKVAPDGAYSNMGKYISIGDTQMVKELGLDLDGLGSQGYRIVTINNTIYVVGNSSLACVFGVYGLLNDWFGFEQYSEEIYSLNTCSELYLPFYDVEEVPDIEMRATPWSFVTGTYSYRMKMPISLGQYILPVGDSEGGGGIGKKEIHNSLDIIPYATFSGTHPYWFSESGKQLCYTAHGDKSEYDALVSRIVEVMSRSFKRYPLSENPLKKLVTLTIEDGDGECTCSACLAAKSKYGSNSGAVIVMCNDVAKGLKEWMAKPENSSYKREFTLLFFAYNAYIDAPASYNSKTSKYELNGGLTIRDDVGVFYAISRDVNYFYDIENAKNNVMLANFKAWADVAPSMYLWVYDANNFTYMMHTPTFGKDAFFNSNSYTYFAENDVKLVYNQGAWNTQNATAFAELNVYLESQLLWDSSLDVEKLTDKWFNNVFGAGATAMKRLYLRENAAMRAITGENHEGIPTFWFTDAEAKKVLTYNEISSWFNDIAEARNAISSLEKSNPKLYAKYSLQIDMEWLAPAYWTLRLYPLQNLFNKSSYKKEFKRILGYDSNTGTYKKDIRIGENNQVLLSAYIESL